jgi:hypothetical protein
MKTLEDLRAEETAKKLELSATQKAISEMLSRTLVQCTSNNFGKGCGMGMQIKDLDYIQTHWYEQPHGCMGGDTWHSGEGRFKCPHCGHTNRLYDRPDIEKLKHLFKATINEHKDDR